MPAWYDIKQLDVDRHVDTEQLRQSADWVHDLIDREIERGVPSESIVVAGFSQGGAVSFEAALTYPHRLAGIMALSTYFATAATVAVNPVQQALPLLICHGSEDPVVPESLGNRVWQRCKNSDLSRSMSSTRWSMPCVPNRLLI